MPYSARVRFPHAVTCAPQPPKASPAGSRHPESIRLYDPPEGFAPTADATTACHQKSPYPAFRGTRARGVRPMTGCHLNGPSRRVMATLCRPNLRQSNKSPGGGLETVRRARPAARGKDGRVWKAGTRTARGRDMCAVDARFSRGMGRRRRWGVDRLRQARGHLASSLCILQSAHDMCSPRSSGVLPRPCSRTYGGVLRPCVCARALLRLPRCTSTAAFRLSSSGRAHRCQLGSAHQLSAQTAWDRSRRGGQATYIRVMSVWVTRE